MDPSWDEKGAAATGTPQRGGPCRALRASGLPEIASEYFLKSKDDTTTGIPQARTEACNFLTLKQLLIIVGAQRVENTLLNLKKDYFPQQTCQEEARTPKAEASWAFLGSQRTRHCP